jgi:mannose-6-phosphate isomerase-like protein (cupin superfamily)
MKGLKNRLEEDSHFNENFRQLIFSDRYFQIALMNLKPGEETGDKIQTGPIRYFRFSEGSGKCIVDGNEYNVSKGDEIVVPAGARSNIVNTDTRMDLKLFTISTPPNAENPKTKPAQNQPVNKWN